MITCGDIKTANKIYTKKEFEITITSETLIEPSIVEEKIPSLGASVIGLDKISDKNVNDFVGELYLLIIMVKYKLN